MHHLDVMRELVRRDKNRPSVIIWSVANEPQSTYDEARDYFKFVHAPFHSFIVCFQTHFYCMKRLYNLFLFVLALLIFLPL